MRRGDGDDPQERIADLESMVAALVREHKAHVARTQEQLELLWTVAVPAWLTEAITRAQAAGWIVERRPTAVVFNYPADSLHDYAVELPLPEDAAGLSHVRGELMIRLQLLATAE
jgi:hypothetical protein